MQIRPTYRPMAGISRALIQAALVQTFKKLNPVEQVRNFVMFVVYLSAIASTIVLINHFPLVSSFEIQIVFWLWMTVLIANFSESLAEGRGRAQAQSLRKAKTDTQAWRLKGDQLEQVSSRDLRPGDIVVVKSGEWIPGDGEVVEGIASVDESAITGESAPVIRESGGDRSAVTGGTRVISDQLKVKVTSRPGDSFLDRMIAMIEGAKRNRTPNEIALSILLVAMTVVLIVSVVTLKGFSIYSTRVSGQQDPATFIILVSLLVCLIPTTIGGLLSSIGISGIDRLIKNNVVAMSGKAVEAAGDVDVLLLDKTGTITLGNRMATEFHPAEGISREQLADAAQISSLADETPEGRSIVILAKEKFAIRARNLSELKANFIPFSAKTRMSGVDLEAEDGQVRSIRKGAVDAIEAYLKELQSSIPPHVRSQVDYVAKRGATPLVVCEGKVALGVVELKDVIKGGIRERFAELRKMGIRTIMITGDNPLTAAAIAAEAGVDDFIAEATPEAKLKRIRTEQAEGHLVAMIGDGTNDAPALAQADVGIALNSGTQAAREAGNMIDLDSNPTKLLEVVQIGKKILMTRGAMTTFSVSNDVAKYFAILPAMFTSLYTSNSHGPLQVLDVMRLHSVESAVLSAVIFNALIIVALIPLALKGVAYQPLPAVVLVRRNFLIYGLGGVVVPFLGIKLIDLILVAGGFIG